MSAVITATIKFAAMGALLYMGLCAVLFLFQRSLIYLPHPPSNHHRETITVQVDNAEILVTVLQGETLEAVLYFGGNAEDVSYSLPTFETAFPGHALYLPHYRGYGDSTGKPSEAALFADALALFDMVHEKHPRVFVIGRSLGSSVAVHVASLRPVERLVLVTPFDSILGLAQKLYPFFPVRWLLLDRFESAKFAPKVTAPTLLLAAEMDEIVPRQSAEALLGRFAPGVAEMRIVAGTGHNTISRSPDYIPLLQGRR
jgi:pimeloyl-ACP methyl ester carboxylesterase